MASLTLKTLPLSTNQLYRVFRNRSILSARGRENKEAIAWEARAQYKGQPLKGPVRLKIALYWGDRRKHDIDNIKTLLDSLNGIVWEDDGQVTDLHVTKEYDKENPRVEILLEELKSLTQPTV